VIEIPIKTELLQVLLTYFVALRLPGGTCIVSLRENAWESALENDYIPPEPEHTPLGKGMKRRNMFPNCILQPISIWNVGLTLPRGIVMIL